MGDDESAEGKLVGQILLGGLGVLLLAAGVWGYFGGQNDKIAGGFFVLVGVLVVVLAAFYSHINGIVELGLLKIPMVKARRAEKQIEQGQVVAGNNLEGARKALEEALSRYNVSQFGTPTVTQGPALPGQHLGQLVHAMSRRASIPRRDVEAECRDRWRPLRGS